MRGFIFIDSISIGNYLAGKDGVTTITQFGIVQFGSLSRALFSLVRPAHDLGSWLGDPKARDVTLVKRDLARGYISVDTAAREYGLSQQDIAAVEQAVLNGETF